MKKSTSPTLPTVDGAELMRLARAGVIAEAESIRLDVSKALSTLNAAAVVALAMSASPGEPAAVAVQTLKSKVADMIRALSTSSDELQAAQHAERDRIVPLIAAAGHRTLEIEGIVQGIASRIRSADSRQNGKRDRLMKAGLTGAELDRAAAPFDPSELQAKRTALLVEQDELERFIQTRDPQHLPAGFAGEMSEVA